MRYGIDCSDRSPAPAVLRSHNLSFIARYLDGPGNPKNLTAAEASAAHRGGIDIVTVWETSANRALDGFAAGVFDARAADKEVTGLGAPRGVVIYFAVDFDPAGGAGRTDRYFDGVFSVIGKSRTGIYAGYEDVKRQMGRGAAFGWQTYAWSYGRWDGPAQLRQYSNGHTVGGVSVDLDQAIDANFGQWFYVAPPVRPPVTKRIISVIKHKVNPVKYPRLGPWRVRPKPIRAGYKIVGPINGWFYEIHK